MTNHESSYESTSHRYLWMKNNGQAGWRFRLTDYVADTSIVIVVPHEQVVTMLKEQGLYVTTLAEAEKALQELTEDQAAKLEAIEAATTDHENSKGELCAELITKILDILHPAPPYTFPTYPGAVVKAQHQRSGQEYHFFTQEGDDPLWHSHRGGSYTESEIRANWTDFETISEGVEE